MRRLSSLIALVALCSISFAQSPHGKDFSTNCGDCHTTEGWKIDRNSLSFNHDTTGFPLVGQHKMLDCSMCHKTLLFTNTKTECMSCHTDIHYQTVGFECGRCHTPKSWIVENITEIHQLSRFPLVGAHVTADCYTCHPSASLLNFQPLGVECYDCHKDQYIATTKPNHIESNFSTTCDECHLITSFGWTGANFNHSFFPLTGGHDLADCKLCHITDNYADASPECVSCHQTDYDNTSNPNHTTIGFPTDCAVCHNLNPGWKPADYAEHDALFPIYSGAHNGTWNNCTDCHTTPGDYTTFSCIDCHEHNQSDMDSKHNEVLGYDYNSMACLGCHPTGSAEESYNHNTSNWPLTGAHFTTECSKCHINGYAGTPTVCFACHEPDYNQSTNPAHNAIGITTDCEICHTTQPDWKPALYPNHNESYPLLGAHATISTNCFICHEGNYVNTPNVCFGCHADNYNQTTDPNHIAAQFSTACETCHSVNAWTPATFDHDGQYFPVYSGKHLGTWDVCSDCHTIPADYSIYTCITCHQQGPTGEQHNDVSGYSYNSPACLECHPDGSAEGAFNHNNSIFPLTGAHLTTDCILCHANGYSGTPTVCFACHETQFNLSVNPNHNGIGIPTDCETCHTTNPGWQPAIFPIHDNYYPLTGAHASISTNCFICHEGNYVNSPNECFGCHADDYNQTTDPNHIAAQFPTNCESCHNNIAWTPATFDHDGQYFPIYSGNHQGTWDNCSECHPNAANYAIFTCTNCHEQGPTDENHNGVGGYVYDDQSCLECHPTGSGEGAFNHNNSNFPLTGAHLTTDCILCHANGYAGTPTVCFACHEEQFNLSINPNHNGIGIPTDCETCHSTNPGWEPASFPIHSNYYPLEGAHATISSDCFICHEGDYNNTPNECFGCHADDYNQTTDPNHAAAQFPTTCETCHTTVAWTPATWDHDGQYFPIYSGNHQGTWDNCSECHPNPGNYGIFTCTTCHQQGETDGQHDGVGGYVYESGACYECHPTGSAEGAFDHNSSGFPLTGAHLTLDCIQCHANGYEGTPTACFACHETAYIESVNPDHVAIGIPNDCETCHTTDPGWQPASFPIHDEYYPLTGSHLSIANDCFACHEGDYNGTPNTCAGCHMEDYNLSANPDHDAIGIGTDCETCHTTSPDWQPASFPIHDNYWPLTGAHVNVDCFSCHEGDYNNTPNACVGCHLDDYNGTTDPDHAAAGFPTDCELCHTTSAWVPSTFDHDGLYFPIYSGSHAGEWTTCSQCHPNPADFTVFTCLTCHTAGETNSQHEGVSGYQYNSDACYACHPTGEAEGKMMRPN